MPAVSDPECRHSVRAASIALSDSCRGRRRSGASLPVSFSGCGVRPMWRTGWLAGEGIGRNAWLYSSPLVDVSARYQLKLTRFQTTPSSRVRGFPAHSLTMVLPVRLAPGISRFLAVCTNPYRQNSHGSAFPSAGLCPPRLTIHLWARG
jgi:hypothetical protein